MRLILVILVICAAILFAGRIPPTGCISHPEWSSCPQPTPTDSRTFIDQAGEPLVVAFPGKVISLTGRILVVSANEDEYTLSLSEYLDEGSTRVEDIHTGDKVEIWLTEESITKIVKIPQP